MTSLQDRTPFGDSEVNAGGLVVEEHHGTGGGLDGGECVFGAEEGVAEGGGVRHVDGDVVSRNSTMPGIDLFRVLLLTSTEQ